jgi:hypothetical protein
MHLLLTTWFYVPCTFFGNRRVAVCTVVRKLKDVTFRIFLSSVGIGLIGCTTVRIESGPGSVKIERHFGTLYVSVADAGQARVAQVRSLGLTNTPLGFSAGYTNQMIVQMPPNDCHLVLFAVRDGQFAFEFGEGMTQSLGTGIDKLL